MSAPYKKNKNNGSFKKSNVPCKYFQRGHCSNARCPYLHVRGGAKHPGDGHREDKDIANATNVIVTMLKLFFEKQQSSIYFPDQGALNLSHLAQYGDLTSVASSVNFNTRTFCDALCACVRDTISPPPAILSLDSNQISSFYHLGKAMEAANLHESLRAISLADNQIKSTDIAVELRHFVNLTEVNLVGNPVTSQPDYKQKIKKNLPFLLGLDGSALTAPPLQLPWPRFFEVSVANTEDGTKRYYNSVQQNILQFIQTAVLNPLEVEPAAGVASGVDAVSDVYALNSILTLSLSCADAAISTPRSAGKQNNAANQRNVIRDIVGFRLRQTESNHNVLLGIKSTQVAMGRTKVCAQLEHWLYPKNFAVMHYIHESPDVAVLDNNGFGPNAVVSMKEPLSVVTLHGVMIWMHRSAGARGDVSANWTDAVVMKRNFSRVLTVSSSSAGRWQVVNDMVTLYPFNGTSEESAAGGSPMLDVHPYDVLFSPAIDVNRVGRISRRYRVPESVVATLCQYVSNDLELITILVDLGGIPMNIYEQCAAMVDMNVISSIFLCRLGNRFGIEPSRGVEVLKEHGLNWLSIENALGSQQVPAPQ